MEKRGLAWAALIIGIFVSILPIHAVNAQVATGDSTQILEEISLVVQNLQKLISQITPEDSTQILEEIGLVVQNLQKQVILFFGSTNPINLLNPSGTSPVVVASRSGSNGARHVAAAAAAEAATPSPTLSSITVSPGTATIEVQATQQFTVAGTLSDSSSSSVTVSWSATGGSIDSNGLYTAPDDAGTYTITATESASGFTDTATVTVTEETWYLDFSEYTTGERPSDFRKHRTIGDYDLIVRDDATFTGGKKLKLEGTIGGSRLMALDFIPNNEYQEVVLAIEQSTVNTGAVGGVFVGATTSEMNGGSGISEFGARLFYETSTWYLQTWQYDQGVFNSWNDSINSWYTPGTKVRIRIRRDPNDTNSGANALGSVMTKVWQDGDSEPASWTRIVGITATTPAGEAGIYTNTVSCGAEYDWVGASVDSSVGAPTPEDSYRDHTPLAVSDPDLSGYDYVEDFSGDTLGVLPSNWSTYYQTETTWVVATDGGADDGRVLYGTKSNTGRSHLQYTPTGAATDAEIIGKIKLGSTGSTYGDGGLSIRQSGGTSAQDFDVLNGGLHITTFNGGAYSASSKASFAKDDLTADEWFWMKVRTNGSTMKAKMWRPTELEPNEWFISSSNADVFSSSGGIGLYNYDGSYYAIDVFAVDDLTN